jgi:exosortase/archaeosortase family protein
MDEDAKARAARDMVMDLARQQRESTLADRFIHIVTLKGRLEPLFPVFGAVIIILDLLWNLVLVGSTQFLTYDMMALLVGGFLIVYNYVPRDYHRERAFTFVFLLSLVLLLLVPVMLERAVSGDPASQTGISAYSEYMLAKPVDYMLRASGIWARTDGITLWYETLEPQGANPDDDVNAVTIATSCSGVYSFAIFTSAFIAFVATEFRSWDKRLVWFLALGIIAAYVANLIRMYVIVLVGHFYGQDALLWAHANAGWVIFMAWTALFWWLLFRWFFRQAGADTSTGASPAA